MGCWNTCLNVSGGVSPDCTAFAWIVRLLAPIVPQSTSTRRVRSQCSLTSQLGQQSTEHHRISFQAITLGSSLICVSVTVAKKKRCRLQHVQPRCCHKDGHSRSAQMH